MSTTLTQEILREEERLSDAVGSGRYVPATRAVIQENEGVWFNDEASARGNAGR